MAEKKYMFVLNIDGTTDFVYICILSCCV